MQLENAVASITRDSDSYTRLLAYLQLGVMCVYVCECRVATATAVVAVVQRETTSTNPIMAYNCDLASLSSFLRRSQPSRADFISCFAPS
ncbi:unnamed protein product [Toxocara canis]|uniref:Uncharacterized protein n=1 Tax=Toxocara canis TaxID=6265 RepID=A0A183UM44_TOXCA|nr:unnamed protein product [Toxocara canis]